MILSVIDHSVVRDQAILAKVPWGKQLFYKSHSPEKDKG